MSPENLTLLYFSPTSTTQITLKEIAKGIGKRVVASIDITDPGIRNKTAPEFKNDLVLIGAPVYGGRLPKEAAGYFKKIKASSSLAVLIVLYGNREFEDALLELKDIAVDSGFAAIAAAAFIGEHSFTNHEFLIALNRPDKKDLGKAFSFGKSIKGLIENFDLVSDMGPVEVPGNFPYKKGTSFGTFPVMDVTQECDHCGICVDACPNNAIDENDNYSCLDELCIYCCACIKACPQKARVLKNGPIKDKAKWLSQNCALRKEPEIFLPKN